MRTWLLSSPHKPAGILPRSAPVLGRSNNRRSTGVGMFHVVEQAHAAAPEDGRAPGNRETSRAPLTS
jgi:hypothetical protein